MLSKAFFGQRKRRREDSSAPLRLTGGAGRGGGGAQRRVIRVPGPGRGVYGPAPVAIQNRIDARNAAHQLWNQAAHPGNEHFDFGQMGPLGFQGVNSQRILDWRIGGTHPVGYPWQDNKSVAFPRDNPDACDLIASPGFPPIRTVRGQEIAALEQRGRWLEQVAVNSQLGPFMEPHWTFLGMSDSTYFGLAWSCFYYGLTDLYGGQHHGGFLLISDLVVALLQIIDDIIDIGQGVITDNMTCMIFFEGRTDEDSQQRNFLMCHGKAQSLAGVVASPTYVLERMIKYFASIADDFLFYRVYIHVLTNLGAGSLIQMPASFKKMRQGPFFKGIKGFHLVEDVEDCSCGLDAIIHAMAGALRRIKKVCKSMSIASPEICDTFDRMRRRMKNLTSDQKQGKGRNSKGKAAFLQAKAELASYVGWKCGSVITPEQICEAVSLYGEKHHLDIGVIVFDALQPLSQYVCNYEPSVHMPAEILCLIHWQYPSLDGNVPTGHFDCIDSCNITRWLTARSGGGRTSRFSFRRFSLLPTAEADDKGLFCSLCKHWQRNKPKAQWTRDHEGFQSMNSVTCVTCKVRFRSNICYDLHLRAANGHSLVACTSQFLCPDCNKVHQVSYNCAETFCIVCMKKYPSKEKATHTCFLGHISEKKRARLRQVVYSDMEGSRQEGFHVAVCISSCWTEACDAHRLHMVDTKCLDCKLNTDNWGWFCDGCLAENELELTNDCKLCNERHTRYFEGPQCLSEYMDWIMTEFRGGSVVFHNGGKYDLQILVIELMTTGKYILSKDAMRGSQIIYFTATPIEDADTGSRKKQVRFIDSCNFIQSSLRSFPSMFDLRGTEKGRFPYDLLNQKDWKAYRGRCPGPLLFGITENELKNRENIHPIRKKEIKEILDYISECDQEWEDTKKEWVALEVLEYYALQDTIVLHDGCEIFRHQFWSLVGCDPFQWVTLASAVAGSYRQPEFMKENSIQIFNNQDREWQRQGLRGGRCEPYKLYWKRTKPSEEFKWFDVNSEYPFVQACRRYPMGKVTVDLKYKQGIPFLKVAREFYKVTEGLRLDAVLSDPTGSHGCGLIECEISSSNAFLPILPAKLKMKTYVKNVFQNRTGPWTGYITVLAEAISRHQVIVRKITRIQYWKETSDKLFSSYIKRLYGAKVEASGWESMLNKPLDTITEEDKQEFIDESKRRGVTINPANVKKSAGRRSTAKIMNNCGWGYLCQKPTSTENHFYDNMDTEEVHDMRDFLEGLETDKDTRRIVGQPVGVGHYTRVRTTKKPEDITLREMNKKIAYHVGGQVPAYGLQLVSSGLLFLHSSQVAYTDTDSIGYVYDRDHKEHVDLPTGNYLGDWVNEYPQHVITEFCSLGCKTYFLKMEDQEGKISYKGRFKGIPLSSASFSLEDTKGDIAKLGMEEMKTMLFQALMVQAREEDNKEPSDIEELTYEFNYTNFFKRNPDFKITSRHEKKTVRFTFDKRKILIPQALRETPPCLEEVIEINTEPLNDGISDLSKTDIEAWWNHIGYELDLGEEKDNKQQV